MNQWIMTDSGCKLILIDVYGVPGDSAVVSSRTREIHCISTNCLGSIYGKYRHKIQKELQIKFPTVYDAREAIRSDSVA